MRIAFNCKNEADARNLRTAFAQEGHDIDLNKHPLNVRVNTLDKDDCGSRARTPYHENLANVDVLVTVESVQAQQTELHLSSGQKAVVRDGTVTIDGVAIRTADLQALAREIIL